MQGQLYLLRGHAKGGSAVAVDGNPQFRIFELQVTVHILQFRQLAQGFFDALGAVKKRPHVRPKQRILIQGLGGAATNADGGGHAHKNPHGGRGVEILAQLLGHSLNTGAFVVLCQPHEQNAVVHALAAAHNTHNGIVGRHIGRRFQRRVKAVLRPHHALKRHPLLCLGAGLQHSHVFSGQKALGNDHTQPCCKHQQSQRGKKRNPPVAQNHVERTGIQVCQPVKTSL